jgi:DNA polymerase I-like protein with 3'-5' exonuclease and polymerase domains
LHGIRAEVVGGFLHPFFDLHTAESYRSSSSKPNVHNFPVRNVEVSEIVRRAIIPRKGCEFLEVDYGQQEVRVSAGYNKDPALMSYIKGAGDMHYDRMLELYMLTPEEAGNGKQYKMGRYCAKNMFTFPQFYGSVYSQCAPNLWEAIAKYNLTRADGVSLYQHLREKGITSLGTCSYEEEPREGTFEYHVRSVERRMWGEVFTVYDQWKRDWWILYQEQGGVNTLTGFRMEGYFRRNQILCDPIQGSAFHCLLWSSIHLDRELTRRKFATKLVNEIHDSMLLDGPESEREDVIELVRDIAVKKVAEHWDWINVPLEVEFELAPSNWFEKGKLEV